MLPNAYLQFLLSAPAMSVYGRSRGRLGALDGVVCRSWLAVAGDHCQHPGRASGPTDNRQRTDDHKGTVGRKI